MSPSRIFIARRATVAIPQDVGSLSFGFSLPPRIPFSTGSVYNVTTATQLRDRLADVPYGSIIDGGGNTFDISYGAIGTIWYWQRNPPSPCPVTTLRNVKLSGSYLGVKSGSYFRFENVESINSAYPNAGFGFRCEGTPPSHHIEWLRCKSNNSDKSGWMIHNKSDYWQIWDSESYSSGTDLLSHAAYLESHSSNCVVANFLATDYRGYGLHVSTDALLAASLTDGIICTGITSRRSEAFSACVVYSAQSNVTQTNCKFVGIVSDDDRYGVFDSWEVLSAGNRLYGAVNFNAGGVNQPLDRVAPVYYNGSSVVSGVVTANPLLDANSRPSASSSAKNIVPPDQYGYLPALDKDGNPRLTADAGCYRVPA